MHFFPVPGYVSIHCRHPVAKHNNPHNGGWNQQLSINTEPCEVQADLLPKVLSVESKGEELGDESDSGVHGAGRAYCSALRSTQAQECES